MVNKDFFLALDDLEREKKINKEFFIEALESALTSAYKKMYRELKKDDLLVIKSIDRLGRNYHEIRNQVHVQPEHQKLWQNRCSQQTPARRDQEILLG